MRLITVVSDPANIGDRKVYSVPDGTNLAAWIIGRYRDGFKVPTSIYYGFVAPSQLIDHTQFAAVNINIAEYVLFSEKYKGEKGDLDCDYYVYPENLEKAKEHFKEVPKMLEAFEHWFGPYPFY